MPRFEKENPITNKRRRERNQETWSTGYRRECGTSHLLGGEKSSDDQKEKQKRETTKSNRCDKGRSSLDIFKDMSQVA